MSKIITAIFFTFSVLISGGASACILAGGSWQDCTLPCSAGIAGDEWACLGSAPSF